MGFAFDEIDQVKQATHLNANRAYVLIDTIQCCANGGNISIPGVDIGNVDNFPFGALINKALTLTTGKTHMQKFLQPLLEKNYGE